ncbi:MAG: aminotransferase class I/II-fold pyridoxal phosphate-dependent enzyme, partial [Gammaproteobacteria bacterium]|nr:aminotransferase class I/II-fold pyridoxal phosphate-dependent enzyme [Gammaproteobacteria bacterium]
MNRNLDQLHPYPFEKLKQLKQGINPPQNKTHIALSIGEPKHKTPALINEVLINQLDGIGKYPTTKGIPELREAISNWVSQRFHIPLQDVNAENQVIPVSGTREALFSFAQAVVDSSKHPVVIMPNPFYQIYEGA